MTFFTDNQEYISEPNNILLEIWEPNNIFFSIFPNKIALTNIFVVSSLTHHQRPSILTYFPFINDFFKPEILDLNGQLLLPEKLIVNPPTTNVYNGINIPPNESLV
jgi:hypothetical protein